MTKRRTAGVFPLLVFCLLTLSGDGGHGWVRGQTGVGAVEISVSLWVSLSYAAEVTAGHSPLANPTDVMRITLFPRAPGSVRSRYYVDLDLSLATNGEGLVDRVRDISAGRAIQMGTLSTAGHCTALLLAAPGSEGRWAVWEQEGVFVTAYSPIPALLESIVCLAPFRIAVVEQSAGVSSCRGRSTDTLPGHAHWVSVHESNAWLPGGDDAATRLLLARAARSSSREEPRLP